MKPTPCEHRYRKMNGECTHCGDTLHDPCKPTPCQHKTISESSLDGKLMQRNCVDCGKDFMPTPEEKCTCITPPSILCPVHGNSPSPEAKCPRCGKNVSEGAHTCRVKKPSPEARVDWEKCSMVEIRKIIQDAVLEAEMQTRNYGGTHCTEEWDLLVDKTVQSIQAAFEKGREAR
jgi:hypothetical protein